MGHVICSLKLALLRLMDKSGYVECVVGFAFYNFGNGEFEIGN